MRWIYFCVFLCFVSCSKSPDRKVSDSLPEYRLIKSFSNQIRPETGLVLHSYGVNNHLPRHYRITNRIANYDVCFVLYRGKADAVSIEQARSLLVTTAEGLKNTVNSCPEVSVRLDHYPMEIEEIHCSLRFKDADQVDLQVGVSEAVLSHGVIKYKHSELGRHVVLYEECYEVALQTLEGV